MWFELAEIFGLILFTSVKFLFAPTTVMALGYSFWETIIISLIGGWFGVFVFYYTGSAFFDWLSKFNKRKHPKRKFSKRNRFVIWLKNEFGLLGMSIILGFASIPIVTVVAAKYFRGDKRTIYFMLTSIVCWSFFLTGLSFWLKPYLLRFL